VVPGLDQLGQTIVEGLVECRIRAVLEHVPDGRNVVGIATIKRNASNVGIDRIEDSGGVGVRDATCRLPDISSCYDLDTGRHSVSLKSNGKECILGTQVASLPSRACRCDKVRARLGAEEDVLEEVSVLSVGRVPVNLSEHGLGLTVVRLESLPACVDHLEIEVELSTKVGSGVTPGGVIATSLVSLVKAGEVGSMGSRGETRRSRSRSERDGTTRYQKSVGLDLGKIFHTIDILTLSPNKLDVLLVCLSGTLYLVTGIEVIQESLDHLNVLLSDGLGDDGVSDGSSPLVEPVLAVLGLDLSPILGNLVLALDSSLVDEGIDLNISRPCGGLGRCVECSQLGSRVLSDGLVDVVAKATVG